MMQLYSMVVNSGEESSNLPSVFNNYRRELVFRPLDYKKVYRSKNITCLLRMHYNFLLNPQASFDQLANSYTFKLLFFEDNELGTKEDQANIIKIDRHEVQRTVDFPTEDLEL